MITGEQRTQLVEFILAAYASRNVLNQLLLLLNLNFSEFSAESKGHCGIIYDLPQKAEEAGWLQQFVGTLLEDGPNNLQLRRWADRDLPILARSTGHND